MMLNHPSSYAAQTAKQSPKLPGNREDYGKATDFAFMHKSPTMLRSRAHRKVDMNPVDLEVCSNPSIYSTRTRIKNPIGSLWSFKAPSLTLLALLLCLLVGTATASGEVDTPEEFVEVIKKKFIAACRPDEQPEDQGVICEWRNFLKVFGELVEEGTDTEQILDVYRTIVGKQHEKPIAELTDDDLEFGFNWEVLIKQLEDEVKKDLLKAEEALLAEEEYYIMDNTDVFDLICQGGIPDSDEVRRRLGTNLGEIEAYGSDHRVDHLTRDMDTHLTQHRRWRRRMLHARRRRDPVAEDRAHQMVSHHRRMYTTTELRRRLGAQTKTASSVEWL